MVNFMVMTTESCVLIETRTDNRSETKNRKEDFFGRTFTVENGQCNELTPLKCKI